MSETPQQVATPITDAAVACNQEESVYQRYARLECTSRKIEMRYAEATAWLRESRAQLAAKEQELAEARKNYLDLADSVCRSSTSVEDACRQARDTRQQLTARDATIEGLREALTKFISKGKQDDGIDPEAYWIELTSDEYSELQGLVHGYEQLSGTDGDASAKTEDKQPTRELPPLPSAVPVAESGETATRKERQTVWANRFAVPAHPDTARLDWLDEHGTDAISDFVPTADGDVSLRAAIDAAMADAARQSTGEQGT